MDNYKEISTNELLDNEEAAKKLYESIKARVKKAFSKRKWEESFTEEELREIGEIDRFLRRVSLHEDFSHPDDCSDRYFIVVIKVTGSDSYGNEISFFYHKVLNQKDFYHKKIPMNVAKAIYKLAMEKDVDLFFAVNSFIPRKNEEKGFYMVERKRRNVISAKCIYTDIDLPEELQKMGNEELLEWLQKEYKDVFEHIPPSYIVRSGGGIHRYYSFFESISLFGENEERYKEQGLYPLMKIFESIGADRRVVDAVRILRVPFGYNRKPKYGPEGKKVEIIYETEACYNAEELFEALQLFQNREMSGDFTELLDELFPTYEEELTETEVQQPGALGDEVSVVEKKSISEMIGNRSLEEQGYKGVQPYFDTLGETFYQNLDLLWHLKNISNHEGIRNSVYLVCVYNWITQNKISDISVLQEKAQRLNTILNPPLSKRELEITVTDFYKRFITIKNPKRIRNIIIQKLFAYTEEERAVFIGSYSDCQSEVDKLSKEKKYQKLVERRHSTESYQHYKEKKEFFIAVRQLIRDNPLMTYKEVYQLTGISEGAFCNARREILNEIKDLKQQEKDNKYFALFYENPNITQKEYVERMKCGKETYQKYRKRFQNKKD